MDLQHVVSPKPADTGAGRWLSFEHRAARGSKSAVLILLLGVLGLSAIVSGQVTAALLGDEALRQSVVERPLSGVLALGGLVGWLALFGWPAARLARAITGSTAVEIDGVDVRVVETGLFGRTRWSKPLGDFLGVTRLIRTQVDGVQHELVLVHADRSSCVTVAVAERFEKSDVEDLARRLGLNEVPVRWLYESPVPARPSPVALPTVDGPLKQAA